MFSHVVVAARDLDAARRFYDAALGALGYAPGAARADGYSYMGDAGLFSVMADRAAPQPADGERAIGFTARSREDVDRWHAAGLGHGGKAVDTPPTERSLPGGRVYLGVLRDPHGNRVSAIYPLTT
jgi:catechol 2,3-dioxygenase-like lactoylglutathione lyase family enzyme